MGDIRRGRPAIVRKVGDNYTVSVNGQSFTFKFANNRLTPAGETRLVGKNEDYTYAQARIKQAIATGNLRETEQE